MRLSDAACERSGAFLAGSAFVCFAGLTHSHSLSHADRPCISVDSSHHPSPRKALHEQAKAKFDPRLQQEAQTWIEQLTGARIEPSFAEGLKDGRLLCQYVV